MKKTITVALAICLLLCLFACANKNQPTPAPSPEPQPEPAVVSVRGYEKPTTENIGVAASKHIQPLDRREDDDYDEENLQGQKVIYVHLKDNESTVTDEEGVPYVMSFAKVSGNIITIDGGGTFRLDGKLTDGQLFVNTDDVVQVIFDGVEITCSSRSAVKIGGKGKKVLTMAEGTKNSLSDGAERAEGATYEDAVIYSSACLTIDGKGELTLTARYEKAVSAKALKIIETPLTVTETKGTAIRSSESTYVYHSVVKIASAGESFSSDGDVTSVGSGLDLIGEVNARDVMIFGGYAEQKSDGDGMKAKRIFSASDSILRISARGDGIVSTGEKLGETDGIVRLVNSSVVIADGDDGIRAKYLTISSGTIFAYGESAQLNVSEGMESYVVPQETLLFSPLPTGRDLRVGAAEVTLEAECRCFVYVGRLTNDGFLYVGEQKYAALW